MAGIAPIDFLDLVKSTNADHPRGYFTELASETQFPGVRLMFEKAVEKPKSGLGFEWSTRIKDDDGALRLVNLYEITPNNVINVLATSSVQGCMFEMKCLYDKREKRINGASKSDINQLVSIIQARYSAMWGGGMKRLDRMVMLTPNDATDKNSVLGIPFWLPKLGSGVVDSIGGFNATTSIYQDGSTTTSQGGIDRTLPENTLAATYAGTYDRVDSSFIDLLARAQGRTDFELLPELKGRTKRDGGERWLLGSHDMMEALERYVNLNDPRGSDVRAIKNEEYKIRGMKPMRYPQMRFDYNDSLIGIYTKHIYGVVQDDNWMDKQTFEHGANPNIVIDQIDGNCQIICDDPQKAGFHLHRPAA